MFNKLKFKACIVEAGLTISKLAKMLGINEATLYRKINRDGDFSRKEIQKLKTILKISNPDEIFFEEKLT